MENQFYNTRPQPGMFRTYSRAAILISLVAASAVLMATFITVLIKHHTFTLTTVFCVGIAGGGYLLCRSLWSMGRFEKVFAGLVGFCIVGLLVTHGGLLK